MFRFKQFIVRHDLCAMKVGTDGVLLGAWADCSVAKNILDVGAGSGLIALMLAQRSEAIVHAIDIDESAFQQSLINFEGSPFSDRLSSELCAYQEFFPPMRYDLIVSNPPYFSDSLKSPDVARSHARHNDGLSVETLIIKSASLLSAHGKVAIIFPSEGFDSIHKAALDQGLFLSRKTIVRPMADRPPKRVLLEYSLSPTSYEENELYLEKSRHVYSDDYAALTKDFYLFKPLAGV